MTEQTVRSSDYGPQICKGSNNATHVPQNSEINMELKNCLLPKPKLSKLTPFLSSAVLASTKRQKYKNLGCSEQKHWQLSLFFIIYHGSAVKTLPGTDDSGQNTLCPASSNNYSSNRDIYKRVPKLLQKSVDSRTPHTSEHAILLGELPQFSKLWKLIFYFLWSFAFRFYITPNSATAK